MSWTGEFQKSSKAVMKTNLSKDSRKASTARRRRPGWRLVGCVIRNRPCKWLTKRRPGRQDNRSRLRSGREVSSSLRKIHSSLVADERVGVSVPWRLLLWGCKRKHEDIWTQFEVRCSFLRFLILHRTSPGWQIYEAMTAAQMRIAETIDAFYGDAGAKDGVSRSYKQAVEDLDAETIKALDGPYRYDLHPLRLHLMNAKNYRTTVLEPISRFCAYFPDINECTKAQLFNPIDRN